MSVKNNVSLFAERVKYFFGEKEEILDLFLIDRKKTVFKKKSSKDKKHIDIYNKLVYHNIMSSDNFFRGIMYKCGFLPTSCTDVVGNFFEDFIHIILDKKTIEELDENMSLKEVCRCLQDMRKNKQEKEKEIAEVNTRLVDFFILLLEKLTGQEEKMIQVDVIQYIVCKFICAEMAYIKHIKVLIVIMSSIKIKKKNTSIKHIQDVFSSIKKVHEAVKTEIAVEYTKKKSDLEQICSEVFKIYQSEIEDIYIAYFKFYSEIYVIVDKSSESSSGFFTKNYKKNIKKHLLAPFLKLIQIYDFFWNTSKHTKDEEYKRELVKLAEWVKEIFKSANEQRIKYENKVLTDKFIKLLDQKDRRKYSPLGELLFCCDIFDINKEKTKNFKMYFFREKILLFKALKTKIKIVKALWINRIIGFYKIKQINKNRLYITFVYKKESDNENKNITVSCEISEVLLSTIKNHGIPEIERSVLDVCASVIEKKQQKENHVNTEEQIRKVHVKEENDIERNVHMLKKMVSRVVEYIDDKDKIAIRLDIVDKSIILPIDKSNTFDVFKKKVIREMHLMKNAEADVSYTDINLDEYLYLMFYYIDSDGKSFPINTDKDMENIVLYSPKPLRIHVSSTDS